MPPSAFALLGVFTGIAVAAGVLAARIVGPWRSWTPVLPTLAAFFALWLVGHRLNLVAGPTITLFGFRVSIVLDVAVAVGAAFAGALAQAGVRHLLDADERGAGRNRLA